MLQDNWFSNFVPFDIPYVVDGISYPTPEHFYQAMKSDSKEVRAAIAALTTPGKAKRAGQKVKLDPNWSNRKLEVMQEALSYKFTIHTSHGKRLMETEGRIVEWNGWHDNFWGHCICPGCINEVKLNWLGCLLEERRSELQQCQ